jgi:hypothetical protein
LLAVVEEVGVALGDPVQHALEVVQIIKLVFQNPDHDPTIL